MIREKKKSITQRTTRTSHRDACPSCEKYFIPNETTRRAIVETKGSLTFADVKSAQTYLMSHKEYCEPNARRKAELDPSCYRTLAAFRKAVANGTVDASKGCRTMGEYHWSLEHGKV